MTTRQQFDQEKAEAFAERMIGVLNAREMLKEAGFKEVESKQLPHDFFNSYYIVSKD